MYILKNLILLFCIVMTSQVRADGHMDFFIESAPIATPAPATDVLDPQFVEIKSQDRTYNQFSILNSFIRLFAAARSTTYSLLNWKISSREATVIPRYSRKLNFGDWVHDPRDTNCYNTRAKVLIRDSKEGTIFKENNPCVVEKGLWFDEYTDASYSDSKDIQIDHVVPLRNAYLSGAYAWTPESRCLYANFLGDKDHLMSVNGRENMKKSDRSPERYMPPNAKFACQYLKTWLQIKFTWGLTMTVAEASGIRAMINQVGCDTNEFVMTKATMMELMKFAQDNIEICRKKPTELP